MVSLSSLNVRRTPLLLASLLAASLPAVSAVVDDNAPAPPAPPSPIAQQKIDLYSATMCAAWAKQGECSSNPDFMLKQCAASCAAWKPRDRYADRKACGAWAHEGECSKNPSFMLEECAGSCADVGVQRATYEKRCPRDEGEEPALRPGELMPLFERAVSNFPELSPSLLSPSPPIALFENFLSPDEIDAFIEAGRGKYERSTALGMRDDGTMGSVRSVIRTSSNTWCQDEACLSHPAVQKVTERIQNVTGVPHTHSEFAQLLEYKACPHEGHEACQFYGRHSDYIPSDKDRLQGVRILTLFIYLTNVTKGGHTTFFTDPGISVEPRAGRAVLWSSVRDEDPHAQDSRTEHSAEPVYEGTKLAANFWFHQYDFKAAYAQGCAMG